MSDPVIGAVAQMLLGRLLVIVASQSGYALEFKPQLEKIQKNVDYMSSLLIDLQKTKQKLETVKKILNDLRELIYEADDVIVDCQIRQAYRNMKRTNPCCTFLSSPEMVFRYKTGKQLKTINSKISIFREHLKDVVAPLEHPVEDSGSQKKRWTTQFFDQSEIVGLEEDTKKIRKWILAEGKCSSHRVGIVGMGGLGKTTLAKKIFNDRKVKVRYLKTIWISVSQTVDEVQILKTMLGQGDASGCDQNELLNKVRQRLCNTSYLIVLDDVWGIEDGWWDRIFGTLMSSQCSSCILVTSRKEGVVEGMGVEEIHRPEVLNEVDSWTLFCKVAFKSKEGECTDIQLEKEGKEIVRKCGGLPLAIKAIGGLLASKPHSYWRRIRENFYSNLGNDSQNNMSVMASLQLSYDDLHPKLKQCMLCFSIYPEDHEIDAGQLVRWWVSEGFVCGKGTEAAMEVAFDCLGQLISRCLVEPVRRRNFDGRVYRCKVHDLVRELMIKISGEEDFCSFNGLGIQISNINTRRLGVTKDTTFQTLQGNKKLRVLILTTFHSIGFKKHIALANVLSLRVLDLSYLKLDDDICLKDLWHWITSLKRLAYLNLSYVAKLDTVPDSIRKLWDLQILILRENRDLKVLPRSILTLPTLTILDVGNCPSLPYLPRGLSGLISLQELYGFKITGPGTLESCCFSDLKALTQLRVLQLEITDASAIDEFTILKQLQQLRVLTIDAGDVEDQKMTDKLEKLSPPPCIEELYLRRFGGKTTPAWMNPTALPELLYLCIESSRTLTQMTSIFEGNNWKMEGLCLKFLRKLQANWSDFSMMSIKYLEVSHCDSLEGFPSDFDVKGYGTWRFEEKDRSESKSQETSKSEECDTTNET